LPGTKGNPDFLWSWEFRGANRPAGVRKITSHPQQDRFVEFIDFRLYGRGTATLAA
jgi:hypothetical protein